MARERAQPRAHALAASIAVAFAAGCHRETHDLTTAQLSAVVDAGRPAIKHCYDVALETFPYQQEMRMQAVIHIAPSGSVRSVKLRGGGGLPGMTDCLKQAILAWRFPQAKDPTDTSLPLVFHPELKPPEPNLDTLRRAFQEIGAKPQEHTPQKQAP